MNASKLATTVATLAIAGLTAILLQASAVAQVGPLTFSNGNSRLHLLPTVNDAAVHRALAALYGTPPLLYNGGQVMPTTTLYAIFWIPSQLQNGGTTSMSTHYRTVQTNFLKDYNGHGIDNNNTQYYQVVSTTTTFIQNKGAFGGAYVDTSAYPASGCSDPATPSNCISDAQIQAEIQKVMGLKGWTGGLTKMFLLFTSSGEGSCIDSGGQTYCAYTTYCAYHGYISGNTPIIYSNQPYGDLNVCAAGQPSPTGDPVADSVASTASHEVTEAITDPLLTAWYTSDGYEIGDICAYLYGTASWDSGKANEDWNGHFYELQMEYDNHTGACVQLGP